MVTYSLFTPQQLQMVLPPINSGGAEVKWPGIELLLSAIANLFDCFMTSEDMIKYGPSVEPHLVSELMTLYHSSSRDTATDVFLLPKGYEFL